MAEEKILKSVVLYVDAYEILVKRKKQFEDLYEDRMSFETFFLILNSSCSSQKAIRHIKELKKMKVDIQKANIELKSKLLETE